MFSIIPENDQKVQALSYVISKAQKDNIILKKGDIFRGHEFHYSKVDIGDSDPEFAFKILRGRGILDLKDGLMNKNAIASYCYPHIPAFPQFALNFTRSAASIEEN